MKFYLKIRGSDKQICWGTEGDQPGFWGTRALARGLDHGSESAFTAKAEMSLSMETLSQNRCDGKQDVLPVWGRMVYLAVLPRCPTEQVLWDCRGQNSELDPGSALKG